MNFKFWGVRGTAPASGRGFTRYGGQTPCASIETPEEELVVIDAGTGLRILGDRLIEDRSASPLRIHLLLTHFHLDHIIGLPLFPPLFLKRTSLFIYADGPEAETRGHLERLMSGRFFPVSLTEAAAEVHIRQIPKSGLTLGGVKIDTCPLIHPQGSVAYRFSTDKQNLVYATDTEHPDKGVDMNLARFCRDADELVYDAMYTGEEYERHRRGWGHSTWEAGTNLAREAGVLKLYLSHYSPNYDDQHLDDILRAARQKFPLTYGAHQEGTERGEGP